MPSQVRARMRCTSSVKDDPTNPNHSFSKATPCGSVNMTITNPAAAEAFEVGKVYDIDFTPQA